MKKLIASVLFLMPVIVAAQDEHVTSTIDNIRYVMDVPSCSTQATASPSAKFEYNNGCGDHLFWQVVDFRLMGVPKLISLIDDVQPSQAKLPDGKGYYKTGDVALLVLNEIIHGLPVEELSGLKMSSYKEPYVFYTKGLKKDKVRKALKEALSQWYEANKEKLDYTKSDEFANCTCAGKHPIGGYFSIKK